MEYLSHITKRIFCKSQQPTTINQPVATTPKQADSTLTNRILQTVDLSVPRLADSSSNRRRGWLLRFIYYDKQQKFIILILEHDCIYLFILHSKTLRLLSKRPLVGIYNFKQAIYLPEDHNKSLVIYHNKGIYIFSVLSLKILKTLTYANEQSNRKEGTVSMVKYGSTVVTCGSLKRNSCINIIFVSSLDNLKTCQLRTKRIPNCTENYQVYAKDVKGKGYVFFFVQNKYNFNVSQAFLKIIDLDSLNIMKTVFLPFSFQVLHVSNIFSKIIGVREITANKTTRWYLVEIPIDEEFKSLVGWQNVDEYHKYLKILKFSRHPKVHVDQKALYFEVSCLYTLYKNPVYMLEFDKENEIIKEATTHFYPAKYNAVLEQNGKRKTVGVFSSRKGGCILKLEMLNSINSLEKSLSGLNISDTLMKICQDSNIYSQDNI